MQNDSPENSVKTIWLNQPTEKPTMISKLIAQKSRDLRTRTRRGLMGTVTAPLAAGIFYAFSMKASPALRQVLQPLILFALSWGLAGVHFLNRGMWSAATPGDLGPKTGLQACRLEIERQRDLARRLLVWSFAPLMLTVATFILALALIPPRGRGIFPNGLPFLIVLVVWIVLFFVLRSREQRKLQREIDELKEIEMENRN
jgi:type II secretory pathway component PulM